MRRTKQKQPVADAILTADLHLTDSTPISRTDDYIIAQERKLQFLKDLSSRNNHCPVLCAGDVFDNWKASPWLCTWAYLNLPGPLITIPGQHDLPMHSLEYYNKSALCLLEEVRDDLKVLERNETTHGNLYIVGVPFGELNNLEEEKITAPRDKTSTRKILILHELTWPSRKPIWGKTGNHTGMELLSKYGNYFDLILTGDNHDSFVRREKGATGPVLVNPGSMMRMAADQANYKPKCYLYYTKHNEVKEVEFPISHNVHDRDHIDKNQERDERIAAYIERMNKDWEIGLSFRKNLQAFFAENQTPQKIREVIWQHLEEEEVQ